MRSVERPLEPNPAGFQHVGPLRQLQRHPRVLLDERDRHLVLAIDREDRARDLAYDQGGKAERGLVEQQKLRLRHLAISARASATICCSPPESVLAYCRRHSRSRGKRS
jgi:hypothetical protein